MQVAEGAGAEAAAVLVQLHKAAVQGAHAHVLPREVPQPGHLEVRVDVEVADLPALKHEKTPWSGWYLVPVSRRQRAEEREGRVRQNLVP
jgi:hypothetical protein